MDYNMGDFDSIISSEEINNLLKELEIATSLMRKKPEDIEKNINLADKKRQLLELQWLNDIYVMPLYEMANRISLKISQTPVEFSGLENLSIMGRMIKIRDYLISKGCSMNNIKQLIPNFEEEVDLLIKAKSQGFDLGFTSGQTLLNSDRVSRAEQFLNSKNIHIENNIIDFKTRGKAM